MNTDEKQTRVAQPAEEEIKLHGDQLARQVKDAAGGIKPHEQHQNNRKNVSKDNKT